MSLGLHTRMSLHQAPNTQREERQSERSIARRPNTPSRGGNRRVLPRQPFAAGLFLLLQRPQARLPMHCVLDSGLSMVRGPIRDGTRNPLDDSGVTAGRDRHLFAAHRPIPTRIAVLIYAIGLACAIALVVLP